MTLVGYDPLRIDDLWRRVRAAADDLADIYSDDPAASAALASVRLAHAHLELGWLAVLDKIRSNTAMIAPMAVHPGEVDDDRSWFDDAREGLFGRASLSDVTMLASNAEALAEAEAAQGDGALGMFAGTTVMYEVVQAPTSTTLPNAQHCALPGCARYEIVRHERWYFEHNLGDGPSAVGGVPMVRWAGLAAKLFGRRGSDEALEARGRELEELAAEVRASPRGGDIGKSRDVAVGRLTRADGEEVDFRAVSGKHPRDGFEPAPTSRALDSVPRHDLDAELKILESVVRTLRRSDADSVLEIFTELPPCASCSRALEQFHQMYPNLQVRLYFRLDVLAG